MLRRLFPPKTKAVSAPGGALIADEDKIRVEVASQWQLMWRKFKRHKVAMIGGVVVLMFYLTALLADFVAPTHFTTYNKEYVNAPPQTLRLFRGVIQFGKSIGQFQTGQIKLETLGCSGVLLI